MSIINAVSYAQAPGPSAYPYRSPTPHRWLLWIAWCGLWIALSILASRNGFEGDDVAQISGLMHFHERGPNYIYRYYWQPLNYQGFAAFLQLGLPIRWLPAAVAFFGATAVIILLIAAQRRSGSWLLAIVALLTIPELLISGLFFNAKIVAAVPLATAVLIGDLRPGSQWMPLAIGCLGATACLLRFEMLLALPLLACWSFMDRPWRDLGRACLAFAFVLSIAAACGLLKPFEVWRLARLASLDAKAFDWTARDNLRVLSTLALPLGTLPLAGIIEARRQKLGRLTLWLCSTLSAVVPASALMTPNYILGGMMFVPILTATALRRYWNRTLVKYSVTAVVAAVYLSPHGASVMTHDAWRVRYGLVAYLFGWDSPRLAMMSWVQFPHDLAERLARRSGCSQLYPGDDAADWSGDWEAWTWPSYYLEKDGFVTTQYDIRRGIVLNRGDIEIRLYPAKPAAESDQSSHCGDFELPNIRGSWGNLDSYAAFWRRYPDL